MYWIYECACQFVLQLINVLIVCHGKEGYYSLKSCVYVGATISSSATKNVFSTLALICYSYFSPNDHFIGQKHKLSVHFYS